MLECHPKHTAYKEVIDLINQFPTPPHFFHWLAKDEIEFKVLFEQMTGDICERVYQFSLDGLTICTLGGHLNISYLPLSFRSLMQIEKSLYIYLLPEMQEFRQKVLSYSVDNTNYSIICEVYYKDIFCGSGWEVFDLAHITTVYNARKNRHFAISS